MKEKLQERKRPFYYKRWFFLGLWLVFLAIWIRYSVRVPDQQEVVSNLLVNEEIIPVAEERADGISRNEFPVVVSDEIERGNSVDGGVDNKKKEIFNKNDNEAGEVTVVNASNVLPKDIKKEPEEILNRIEGKIEVGESFSRLLKHYRIKTPIAELLRAEKGGILNHLKVGHKYILEQENLWLTRVVYEVDDLTTLEWTKQDGHWIVKENVLVPVEEVKTVTGTVDKSIYLSAKKLGVSSRLVSQFIEAFSEQIDFSRVIANDQFTIIYKRFTLNGKTVKPDEMLAGEMVHRGETYRIIGFENKNKKVSFYTPEGNGVKSSFLRFPLARVDRISSHFNLKRIHPILKVVRPHYGVDLVAKLGTPVLATSSGKIEFKGVKGGYGRVVVIKHGPVYTTLYAHLDKFAPQLVAGKRVQQGQIIGYVGNSGTSTSPHLHYEVRVNNVPQDPLKVKLPREEKIGIENKEHFLTLVKYYEQIFKGDDQKVSRHLLVLTDDRNNKDEQDEKV